MLNCLVLITNGYVYGYDYGYGYGYVRKCKRLPLKDLGVGNMV